MVNQPFLSASEVSAAVAEYGTPLYLYDFHKMESKYTQLQQHLPTNFTILYTLKANSNLSLCSKFARLGAGADISSRGELDTALKVGISPKQITFTGPGKSNLELKSALQVGIGTIVLESANEARRLNDLAEQEGIKQDVLIRINPRYRTSQSCEIREKGYQCGNNSNTDSSQPELTIQLIATSASKFGVDEDRVPQALQTIANCAHLNLKGIHIFTESNVLDYKQLLASWENTIAIANQLNDRGYHISVIDFGGGIGIPYNRVDPEFDTRAFGKELQQIFDRNPYQYSCVVEIGRYLVGEAGCYLTEVIDIKESQGQKFIILDGGVHQLLRLSMKPASKYMEVLGRGGRYSEKATLGGKLPTPLDIMVEDVMVPADISIGDRLVIYNCGAYGFNHSLTNFALHNYPAEVAYGNGKIHLIRERGKIADFFSNQTFPIREMYNPELATSDPNETR
ncbi:hypothetical protein [Roseofilum casamattae]|uniref:Orn/DAP/Arg decarboxylase 2 N-terminal domain-containing protein n=1 Tax=Roseofilum casamattae BLCC-M143 TaxID=3022442 RepID=A0ABT7BX26_9CYAN|nr:hypothetical protein [Roseofilum casamattae]MDJ1183748.1 hypothetical protein [Roseofilum casamattae BLCC-M143]